MAKTIAKSRKITSVLNTFMPHGVLDVCCDSCDDDNEQRGIGLILTGIDRSGVRAYQDKMERLKRRSLKRTVSAETSELRPISQARLPRSAKAIAILPRVQAPNRKMRPATTTQGCPSRSSVDPQRPAPASRIATRPALPITNPVTSIDFDWPKVDVERKLPSDNEECDGACRRKYYKPDQRQPVWFDGAPVPSPRFIYSAGVANFEPLARHLRFRRARCLAHVLANVARISIR